MKIIINFFWNSQEKRLRSFFRLIIQTVFMIILSGLAGLLVPNLNQIIPALGNFTFLTQILFSLAVILSVFLAGVLIDRRRFVNFGLKINKKWWKDLFFGLFLGAFLMGVIFSVELSMGWIDIKSIGLSTKEGINSILQSLLIFIGVGVYEEILSRGYHLRNMSEGLSTPRIDKRLSILAGWLLSSSIFGLLHAANPNTSISSILLLIVAGLFLGLGVILTGQLAISIGLHITWNFFQGNIFGFPVSGISRSGSVIQIHQGGPLLWTGGDFGPEAGLMGLLAIIFGCIMIIIWVRRNYGKIRLHKEYAIYKKG